MSANSNPSKRAAIYTRKSTSDGLTSDFNSIDAQREAAEAYITSQKHEGWEALSRSYDDGGFTGANIERPGLQRLLNDIESNLIDVVVVHRVDRLSRSLVDFCKLIEIFDQHSVSFVSVTQHFSTTHPMGKLTLHILLSFAEFERSLIADRTRTKVHAARQKGKWTGGRPILGYDLSPKTTGLIINETESDRVRQIFQLYLDNQSLGKTARELNIRGWHQKSFVNKSGTISGGGTFTKNGLHRLISNPMYIGKLRLKGQLYDGEHPPIVDLKVFQEAQRVLSLNRTNGGDRVKNQFAILKGLLYCKGCDRTMTPSLTTKRRSGTVYRYYVCSKAAQEGYSTCSNPSLSAPEIEKFVVDRVKIIGNDYSIQEAVWNQLKGDYENKTKELEERISMLTRERRRLQQETKRAIHNQAGPEQFSHLEERFKGNEEALAQTKHELSLHRLTRLDKAETTKALRQFTPIWERINTREKCEFLQTLLSSVSYDGHNHQTTLFFRSDGLKKLLRNDVK